MPTPVCIAYSNHCVVPAKATDGSAGFDLSSVERVVIPPGERRLVSTGLQIESPVGTYGRLAPRSGLAWKHGIDVLAGVIDRDYTGIVKAVLLNTGSDPFTVEVGDRMCQIIFERYESCAPCKYMTMKLGETPPDDAARPGERGSGGFGSTGV